MPDVFWSGLFACLHTLICVAGLVGLAKVCQVMKSLKYLLPTVVLGLVALEIVSSCQEARSPLMRFRDDSECIYVAGNCETVPEGESRIRVQMAEDGIRGRIESSEMVGSKCVSTVRFEGR